MAMETATPKTTAVKQDGGETKDLSALARLLGRHQHHRFISGKLSIFTMNVLEQPRKSFSGLSELGLDIIQRGQINPLVVARFNGRSARRYITAINLIWGTRHKLSDLKASSNNRGVYYVLLAGERRYRSLHLVWQEGCLDCQERYGQEKPGSCFRRHRKGSAKVSVSLCVNMAPLAALFIQMRENTHVRVPPHEEARAYALLFRLIRQAKPKFPVSRFAREVTRSADYIRNALRFCELPVSIQQAVDKRQIRFGIAIELARLADAGLNEQELHLWAMRAIVGNYKVPDFRVVVSGFLESLKGQGSLFDLMSEEQQRLLASPQFRSVVERQWIQAIWSWIHYCKKVLILFQEGKLGAKDSPFSEGSPLRVFRQYLSLLRELLPHFHNLLSESEYSEASEVIGRTDEVTALLETSLEGATAVRS